LWLGETLPTGKYDRLGEHPSDGFGAGVRTTTVSVYAQDFFWMPGGRILRTRLDLSYAFSGSATVRDVSVYGPLRFSRSRESGDAFTAMRRGSTDLTRNWVLALDAVTNMTTAHASRVRTYRVTQLTRCRQHSAELGSE